MLKRIVWLLIAFPVGVVLVALAVANRHGVTLVLDPFRPENPALALQVPLFALVLTALVAGVVIGGTAAWLGQGRWRKAARVRGYDAKRWQAEADRLSRERDTIVSGQKQLAAAR